MITSLRMFRLGLGLWVAVSACSDSTPIGTVECLGERIRCGPSEKQRDPDAPWVQPPRETVSSTAVATLTPSWTGRPFGDDTLIGGALVVDPEGDLWSASVAEDRVQLTKLDRKGVTVERHTIGPPKSVRDPSALRAGSIEVKPASAYACATIDVHWTRGCDGREGESNDCDLVELLVFENFAEPPRRVFTGVTDGIEVQANRSGVWMTYSTVPRVEKIDNSANLIWRQTGLVQFDWYLTTWRALSLLRKETELSVLVWNEVGPIVGLNLWKLDARGSIETVQRIGWTGVSDTPVYGIDPLGRDVIAGATPEGDLTIMRVLPNGVAEGNVIVREEYLALSPDALAIDEEGTSYVATQAGGREVDQRHELLCRLPPAGAAECFGLGEISATSEFAPLIDDLVVPEPGVAYVRSGSTLRRYELPAQ